MVVVEVRKQGQLKEKLQEKGRFLYGAHEKAQQYSFR
jgi:hypothetical protein